MHEGYSPKYEPIIYDKDVLQIVKKTILYIIYPNLQKQTNFILVPHDFQIALPSQIIYFKDYSVG